MAQQITAQGFPHLINYNEYSEFCNRGSGEQWLTVRIHGGDPCAEIKRSFEMGRVIWSRLIMTFLHYCFSYHWSVCFVGGEAGKRDQEGESLRMSMWPLTHTHPPAFPQPRKRNGRMVSVST